MPLSPDIQLHLVNDIEQAYAFKRWLGQKRDMLGVDTETSSLNPYGPDAKGVKPKLRLVQFGDEMTGWAIPWDQWGGVAMEALNNYEGDLGFHNVDFDAQVLEEFTGWKVPWHRTHCTYTMARIANPANIGRAGLKELSDDLVDPTASMGQAALKAAFKKQGWWWDTVPIDFEPYWVYSALDPVLNCHIKKELAVDKKYPGVYDLEMAVRRICTRMVTNGMRVDLRYSQDRYNEMTERVERAKQWAQDNWNLNVGSNPEVVFFLKKLGAEFTKFSEKTNEPSVDKEQLAELKLTGNKAVAEVADFVLTVRQIEKKSNAYFKNFLEMNVDGILHSTIKTMGARTGRMSVTNPALQTLPRGDALVRDAFIPRTEDELILSCDYSQVEMRLLAHFSRDQRLQEAFMEADATGGDFFVSIGREVYSDPDFTKKDKRRGLMKNTMYGAAYGSGVKKMAQQAGVSIEQMKEASDAVFERFPGIKSFMREIEDLGVRRERAEGVGYTETAMGRRLPADAGKLYALTNYTLQGTAAELMKQAIVRMDAAGLTQFCCMPIHDEMVFSVPKDGIEDYKHEIEDLMSYTNGEFAVPLPAEPEGGYDRWGSKYRKEGEIFGYDVDDLAA
jgi:DNA polymerase-1